MLKKNGLDFAYLGGFIVGLVLFLHKMSGYVTFLSKHIPQENSANTFVAGSAILIISFCLFLYRMGQKSKLGVAIMASQLQKECFYDIRNEKGKAYVSLYKRKDFRIVDGLPQVGTPIFALEGKDIIEVQNVAEFEAQEEV